MRRPIVALLGPAGAGKSVVGRHLAGLLAWQQRSLDASCWEHYRDVPEVALAERELGALNDARTTADRADYLQRLAATIGPGWPRLWERMRTHAILRALEGEAPAVVDFGAGHGRLREPALRGAVEAALAECQLAVWLQPWPSAAASAELLLARLRAQGRSMSRRTLRADCTATCRLRAVSPLYTEEREPAVVAAALRELLRARS
ncbi:MAG: hypothetical protein KC636_01105 [Myxococcales bacterium]|nr:hypothetical protein [Myxococcales bacterium]